MSEGDYTIVTIRSEIEAHAHNRYGDVYDMLDIATTRLAWALQNFPEAAASYDRVWRGDALITHAAMEPA